MFQHLFVSVKEGNGRRTLLASRFWDSDRFAVESLLNQQFYNFSRPRPICLGKVTPMHGIAERLETFIQHCTDDPERAT
jgi:hypothetical protein